VLVSDGRAGGLRRFGRRLAVHRLLPRNFVHRLVVFSGLRSRSVGPGQNGRHRNKRFLFLVFCFQEDFEGSRYFFLGVDNVKDDDIGFKNGFFDGGAVTVRVRLFAPLGLVLLGVLRCEKIISACESYKTPHVTHQSL
jgi:hypothetical protein